MEHVATKGPLAISSDASRWSFYSGGVFDGCSYDKNIEINHAIQVNFIAFFKYLLTELNFFFSESFDKYFISLLGCRIRLWPSTWRLLDRKKLMGKQLGRRWLYQIEERNWSSLRNWLNPNDGNWLWRRWQLCTKGLRTMRNSFRQRLPNRNRQRKWNQTLIEFFILHKVLKNTIKCNTNF